MELERKKDIVVSLLIFAISILFYLNSKALTPPADIFPKVVIMIFSILGVFLLVKALFLKKAYHVTEDELEEEDEEVNEKRKWISIMSIVVYILVMPVMGFFITSGVFLLFISLFLIGKKPTVRGSIVPFIVSTTVMSILYFTFNVFLRVPVPSGVLF